MASHPIVVLFQDVFRDSLHLGANPHTVVSPYLRSQGISSRVACRNGGAVTNLWSLGTATTISDSESPIYFDDISDCISFPPPARD